VFDQSAVTVLSQLNARIAGTFGANLAGGATVANDTGTSNTNGHTPNLSLDGNLDTSWQPTGATGALVLTLPGTRTFDVISAQEDLHVGQRVESYAVDAWNGSSWNQIANDTTIGQKKLIRLPSPVTTGQVRLRITGSRTTPTIAEFGLFKRPGGSTAPGSVTSAASGRCLDVNGRSTTPGGRVQIWDCNGGANQSWTRGSAKQLTVYSGTDQLCLDADTQGTAAGTKVVTWTCDGQANQQWNVNSDGTITGVQSGLCLDVTGGATGNGTPIELWNCNGQSNQRWTLG
jgi:alpha-L-fucosidase